MAKRLGLTLVLILGCAAFTGPVRAERVADVLVQAYRRQAVAAEGKASGAEAQGNRFEAARWRQTADYLHRLAKSREQFNKSGEKHLKVGWSWCLQ